MRFQGNSIRPRDRRFRKERGCRDQPAYRCFSCAICSEKKLILFRRSSGGTLQNVAVLRISIFVIIRVVLHPLKLQLWQSHDNFHTLHAQMHNPLDQIDNVPAIALFHTPIIRAFTMPLSLCVEIW